VSPHAGRSNRTSARAVAAIAAVALASLSLTFWGYSRARRSLERTREVVFERQVEIATQALRARFGAYESVLRACEAFFSGSRSVERREWRDFVAALDLPSSVSEAVAVGYAVPVEDRDVADFERAMRDSAPGFAVHPRLADTTHFAVQYLEPMTGSSAGPGFDMGSEANRRTALETARDSGETVISASVRLLHDTTKRPGIFVVHAIYGRPHDASKADRRQALQGWVYLVARVEDVVKGAVDGGAVDSAAEVFDGPSATSATRIFGQDPATSGRGFLQVVIPFEVGHHVWTLRYTETPAFHAASTDHEPLYLLLGGLSASLLLSIIAWSLATTHSRALTLARTMTEGLRRSEEWTRALVDSMLEGLIVVSPRSLIESVNPAAARMFGYECQELIGRHLGILLPPSIGVSADEYLREATRKSLGRMTEWSGLRKSGDVFPFELVLSNFDTPEGQHYAGHLRDISDRRKLEQLKRDFVSTVSHELRTPLTSIRGSLGLLAGGALGELPDEAREVCVIAERNVSRLMGLVNDILDLERMESERMEMHFESAAGGLVVERAVEAVRGMAEQQGVRIEVGACTSDVHGDADRLIQVLVNLLSNAVKFSARGGVVTVSCVARQGTAEFSVEDQGRGVPVELQQAIFERFQQVEASDAREKGGTGLGLAIAKAIVERHGGAIGVESEPGRGSRFWFRVPAGHASDAFLAANQMGGVAADVLLIDDDEALLGVMTRQLMMESVSVRSASTARDAVAAARESQPLVIVLDVALRGDDGFEVVRQLRLDPKLRSTPLVVYSIHDLSDEERARLRLGPTRFLTKSRATDQEFKATVLDMLPIAVGRAS
jgi:PAS domain S-box-containing protein